MVTSGGLSGKYFKRTNKQKKTQNVTAAFNFFFKHESKTSVN